MTEPRLVAVPLDLETHVCVVPGCANSDAGRRGPFTGRCDEHIRVVKENIREGQRNGNARRTRRSPTPHGAVVPLEEQVRDLPWQAETEPPEPAAVVVAPSIAAAARRLVPHADRLEKALLRRRDAVAEAKAALAEFRAAWAEVKTQVDEALR